MTHFDPFITALKPVLKHEGGYSNDPDDWGQETFRGISRRFHPDWPGWVIIDAAKMRDADVAKLNGEIDSYVQDFYRANYWNAFAGDDIQRLSLALAIELLDTSINMGVMRAVTFLQQSLSLLNRNQVLYPDLVEDGRIGPRTIHALEIYLSTDNVGLLLKILNILQGNHYINFMRKSPKQEKYARGWFARVALIRE